MTVLAALPVFWAAPAALPPDCAARLAAAYCFLICCFYCQRDSGLLAAAGFS